MSFGAQKADATLTNVGLTYYGSQISEGAKANTFANLQNLCLGQQSAEQLAQVLSCSPAAGIVQLCPDLYRCGDIGFADNVSFGAGHYKCVTAHLRVFNNDLAAPIMACYAENLQGAIAKAAENFPMPECEQAVRVKRSTNGTSGRSTDSAGAKATLAAVAIYVLLLRN